MTRALVATALAFVLAGCPSSRMGTAAVRDAASGSPCFTVDQRELESTPDLALHAVMLSDLSAGASTVWSSGVTASMPLAGGACLRYGEGTAPPPPLVPGHLYEVFVNASPPRGRGMTQGYTSRFCISDAGRVITVPTDNRLDPAALCEAARSR